MDYKYAVDKRNQLQISAELNGVDRNTIKRIIRDYEIELAIREEENEEFLRKVEETKRRLDNVPDEDIILPIRKEETNPMSNNQMIENPVNQNNISDELQFALDKIGTIEKKSPPNGRFYSLGFIRIIKTLIKHG